MVYSFIETNGYSLWKTAMKEVKDVGDVTSVFASRALVTAVAYVSLFLVGKAFSVVCAWIGCQSLINRIALASILTNPWVIAAITMGIPALSVLCQLAKNSLYKTKDINYTNDIENPKKDHTLEKKELIKSTDNFKTALTTLNWVYKGDTSFQCSEKNASITIDLKKMLDTMCGQGFEALSGIYVFNNFTSIFLQSPEDLEAVILLAKELHLDDQIKKLEKRIQNLKSLAEFYMEQYSFSPDLLDAFSYTAAVLHNWPFFEQSSNKNDTDVREEMLRKTYLLLKQECMIKDKWKKGKESLFNFPQFDGRDVLRKKRQELGFSNQFGGAFYSSFYTDDRDSFIPGIRELLEASLQKQIFNNRYACVTDEVGPQIVALFPPGFYLLHFNEQEQVSLKRKENMDTLRPSMSLMKMLDNLFTDLEPLR